MTSRAAQQTGTAPALPARPWALWRSLGHWQATAHLALDGVAGLAGLVVVIPLIVAVALVPALLIGVVLLVPALFLARGFAAVERFRYAATLGEVIPPPRRPVARSLRSLVLDSAAWRAGLYALLMLVIGCVNTALLVAGWAAALVLVTLPFYFTALTSGAADLGPIRIDTLPPALLVAVIALAIAFLLLPLLTKVLITLDVTMARALLGPQQREELTERVVELTESRSRVVDAAEQERRRMERDLHDGAQQRLVAMSMTVGRLSSRLKRAGDTEAAALADEAQLEVRQAISELRDLTRGLHPPVLTDRGLDAALSAVAARSPIPVMVVVELPERPSLTIESIAYFFVSESLTNVAKHAQASHASVVVRRDGDRIRATVTDDGRGGADAGRGSGLAGLADRAAGVDGTLLVSSPVGGPTIVEMELPCGS